MIKFKKIIYSGIAFVAFLPFYCRAASVPLLNTDTGVYKNSIKFKEGAGFGSAVTNPVGIVSIILQAFLGLLGVIFVILVIMSGFNWMTAGGNSEKVDKAKTTILRAVIGLIIIVSAYAITYFVFKYLPGGDGGGTGAGTSGLY